MTAVMDWDMSLAGWRRSRAQLTLAFGSLFRVIALNTVILGVILFFKHK